MKGEEWEPKSVRAKGEKLYGQTNPFRSKPNADKEKVSNSPQMEDEPSKRPKKGNREEGKGKEEAIRNCTSRGLLARADHGRVRTPRHVGVRVG